MTNVNRLPLAAMQIDPTLTIYVLERLKSTDHDSYTVSRQFLMEELTSTRSLSAAYAKEALDVLDTQINVTNALLDAAITHCESLGQQLEFEVDAMYSKDEGWGKFPCVVLHLTYPSGDSCRFLLRLMCFEAHPAHDTRANVRAIPIAGSIADLDLLRVVSAIALASNVASLSADAKTLNAVLTISDATNQVFSTLAVTMVGDRPLFNLVPVSECQPIVFPANIFLKKRITNALADYSRREYLDLVCKGIVKY